MTRYTTSLNIILRSLSLSLALSVSPYFSPTQPLPPPYSLSLPLLRTHSHHTQERVSPAPELASVDRSRTIVRRGGRLNTKLRAQTTVKELGGEELTIDTFWDRNFAEEDEVMWFKFQQGFLKDYEAQLSGK